MWPGSFFLMLPVVKLHKYKWLRLHSTLLPRNPRLPLGQEQSEERKTATVWSQRWWEGCRQSEEQATVY